MKKTMKKLVATATAAVMTFAMGITAFASPAIVTVAGSMNEWNATDMNAAFADEDGDGIWEYKTNLAAGDYQFKIIIDGAWTPDGMSNNYGIKVAADTEVTFYYNENSTNKYPFIAVGEGVTVDVDVNRADAEGEGKDPEEVKGWLEEAVADAQNWIPASAPADEPAAPADEPTAPADEPAAPAAPTAPQTGDALSLSIVLIGAAAVVAFVASKKRANA